MKKSRSSAIRSVIAILILLLPLSCGLLLIIIANQGFASQSEIGLLLSAAGLIVTMYVALFTGFLSWQALVFAALPRIDIEYRGESNTGRTVFQPSETVVIRFSLRNVGWWYAKPASTNTKLFLNVHQSIEPKTVRYGSNLELAETEARRGKEDSKYFVVDGICLFPTEAAEEVEVAVVMPCHPGTYPIWISCQSDQCDHGTFRYEVLVGSVVE